MKRVVSHKTDPVHAVIIINPVSGSGNFKKRKGEIIQTARALGWKGKMIETTRKYSAGQIASDVIAKGTRHIIIAGGDGTILDVLQVIIDTKIVIGIIPLGTGNLFAQNLSIPNLYIPNINLSTMNYTSALSSVLQTALYGKIEKIDIGQANGTYFAVMAGIGFDAEVMRKSKRALKNKYGLLAYVMTAFKLFRPRASLYDITVDGKKTARYRAQSILFANMGKIQGGMEAIPKANSRNGILQIGIFEASNLPSIFNLAGNFIRGQINSSPHFTLLHGKCIEVSPVRKPKPYQCDGNHFPPTKKLTVEIYPQALHVLVSK